MPAPTEPPQPKTIPLHPPPKQPIQSTLRYPSSRKSIYDRHLNRSRTAEAALASFAYLFNTLITYHHARSPSVSELETRLNRAGYPIGLKLLDLLLYRSTPSGSASGRGGGGGGLGSSGLGSAQRPTRLLDLLQFIHNTLWRALFNRNADALEQSTTKKNEYMIIDNEPVVNSYISIPKEMSQLNCAAFVAGVVEGVCDAAGFPTDGVTAHWGAAEGEEMWPGKTIFLLRFKEAVVEREEALKAGGG
ncbi:TRAPP I complex [Polychaeton citri CBS 116435]|uniref:Trafficking protein particle complex subunit n=1 Tax=Polychaeton citri CBS 116435 TaxID=1314669 RepID=A0A9P4QCM1_9PEZI|nr:TRAPP I complex [Polychaeton citri CBS 116435]